MKTKSIRTIIVMLLVALSLAALPEFPSPLASGVAYADSSIVPYANIVEWRYKIINGRVHRRLYNISAQRWIGEWEPC